MKRQQYHCMDKSYKLGNRILLIQILTILLGWWYVIKYCLS